MHCVRRLGENAAFRRKSDLVSVFNVVHQLFLFCPLFVFQQERGSDQNSEPKLRDARLKIIKLRPRCNNPNLEFRALMHCSSEERNCAL